MRREVLTVPSTEERARLARWNYSQHGNELFSNCKIKLIFKTEKRELDRSLIGLSAELPLPGHDCDGCLACPATLHGLSFLLGRGSLGSAALAGWAQGPQTGQVLGVAQSRHLVWRALQEGRQWMGLGTGRGSGEVAVGQAEGVEGCVA